MVRPIDQLEVTPLLADISRARAPFFSPDSHWIGFFQHTELKKAPVTGGPAISLCAFSGGPRGASWGDDGTVVFATADHGPVARPCARRDVEKIDARSQF